jgi:hypothetical protein
MPKKRANIRPDVAETAFRVMLEATGQAPKTLPPTERVEKNPEAVRRGRLGGEKGGAARARRLSAEKRKAIAKTAASKRWEKKSD